MADTPNGETVPIEPKNDVNNPVTPTVTPEEKRPDPQVAEVLKRAEQAEMRANQLANQLKAKEDAEREARERELEEQNKFKELYDQEKARREQLESEKERAEHDAEIKAKSDEIYKDYPDSVREIAEEADLKLPDTDEDSIEVFKNKLDNFKAKLGNPKINPNNPGEPSPKPKDFNPAIYKDLAKNPKKLEEYWAKHSPVMAQMIKPAE